MEFINIDGPAFGHALRRLRVKLENTVDVSLTVAIQSSRDGVNWTTLRIDNLSIPADPKERK